MGSEMCIRDRFHFEPLAVGQLALPGGIAEVAEAHQRGIRGVGDEDRQGVIEAFTVEAIEVMAVEGISRAGGHLSLGQLQLQAPCVALTAAPAGALLEDFFAAVLAQPPLIQAARELLFPLPGQGALAGLPQSGAKAHLKELLEAPRINRPGDQGRGMVIGVGPVRGVVRVKDCLLYTSPSPRDLSTPRMPSSA